MPISRNACEFIILYTMHQQARVETICYFKKQVGVSFVSVLLLTMNFVIILSYQLGCCLMDRHQHVLDNVLTKCMINNRTDAWKTEINLFILIVQRDLSLKLPMKLKLSHSIFHPFYFHFRTGASRHRFCHLFPQGLT